MAISKKKNSHPLILYKDNRGNIELHADITNETLWASLDQIAQIFGRDKSVISRHITNIFKEKELDEKATVAKNATVQMEGDREITRRIVYYNLDMVLSVGYRVNSKQATSFRQWATKTLRTFLLKGYVVNERRLRASHTNSLADLQRTMRLIQSVALRRELEQPEMAALLQVINEYAHAWSLLQQFDEKKIILNKANPKRGIRFTYEHVRPAIDALKKELMRSGEASELFAAERDKSFGGILETIYQTFASKELYPSLEEKAAHLLYFVIKDHPFSDGNKRTAAFLFVLFLRQNKILFRKNGERKINDTALVALALLIAESKPAEKDQMIALITQLLW